MRDANGYYIKNLPKDSFDTEDILGPWFIPSLSFVFVNDPDFVLPEWFFTCKYGDLPFMLLLSLRGKFKYLDEVMGVYRLHDNGASAQHNGYDKAILMVYIYECFNIHTQFKYRQKVKEAQVYEIVKHIVAGKINAAVMEQRPSPGFFRRTYRRLKKIAS